MSDHSANTPPSGNPSDPIAELEARLAEIEAGIRDPLSFTSKTLIQATFPHSARAGEKLVLVNGDTTVTMTSRHGLPYGAWPRLIMCWLTREALRRKDMPIEEARIIPLNGSLARFMRDVGIGRATGGKKGTITALKKQMQCLFSTTIGIDVEGYVRDRKILDLDNSVIAERAEVWWTPRPHDEIDFEGYIRLSAAFYKDLTGSAVPLDTRILRNLRKSPLAIDVYSWLTYRVSYLRQITVIRWDQIRGQLGAGYPDTPQGMRNFRKKFLAALDKVLEEWPTKSISVTDNGIMLKPGTPSVPRKAQEEFEKRFATGDENPF